MASTSSPWTHDVHAPPSFHLKDFKDMSAQLEVAKDEAIEAKKAAAIAQEESVQAQERANHLQPLQQRLSEIEDDLHCKFACNASGILLPLHAVTPSVKAALPHGLINTLNCIARSAVDQFTTQCKSTGSKGLMLSLFC
ncbi:hypothetical protein PUNSTDRAFT_138721 [Punctularia strigosozonata HHB-11173 SS5]|uniref:Uncharacterized protein n=1 Tax=Punctularia strigosozonata (strain HHB-11173) TaxID=741275 RepID=R7S3F5_PUNST|nr:uncharacterized protein PUNSTDRAFT_138721 [Punctularia strigosozonata HHB-11173 SS5]EIN04327.1 hypothetical protein PUNSTDRAFT_138721 [Punctularia strigosozonata HHB-11173 SS5]